MSELIDGSMYKVIDGIVVEHFRHGDEILPSYSPKLAECIGQMALFDTEEVVND